MPEFDNPEIFRTILETLPMGVYLVDRSRRILFWNEGAEKISGHLRQDVVGRFLREHLLAPVGEVKEEDSESRDSLTLAFKDGKSSSENVSILHKRGYRLPIGLQTVPIRNPHGEVILVAECFEKSISAFDRTRRKTGTVDLECIDGVTGIPARTFMEQNIRQQLDTFAENHVPFGFLLVQIDDVQHIRAMRGPGVVPSILRVVAQSIENSLRPTDTVGCWSDHTFLALLLGCKEDQIECVAHRLGNIVNLSEVEWWGDTFSVTVAFGGAGSRPGDTLELLAERAEQSLGKSVAAGGNRATVLLE